MKNFILYIILFTSFQPAIAQSLATDDYDPTTVIVKLKKEYRASIPNGRIAGTLPFAEKIKKIGIKNQRQIFPKNSSSQGRVTPFNYDLSGIYKLTIENGADIQAIIRRLQKLPEVEYAEPYFLHKPLFVPNDPDGQAGASQDYLEVIEAYSAWNVERGDSNVVIGIVDTGVRFSHEDLKDNIKYNYEDPINGIDDEGDGYIDNFFGWDIADDDNDPSDDQSTHGTEVAGLNATTNNNIGLAGVGFNCQFLPIKIFNSEDGKFKNGYEGLVYGAEHGCKVLNLSWGGINNFSQFAQDVVNHVVLDLDVVVVAAAGNTNANLDFYPASYEHVLSVGATDINDDKWSSGTYSNFIDIMAPGASVYTAVNNGYGTDSGTSLSSPMVAGAAALLRSRYPLLTAIQIMERLRVNADDIYSRPANQPFNELLGKGRLNIHRALVDNSSPSIRVLDYEYTNGIGEFAFFGDTLTISANFINYLSTTSNAVVTLSTQSSYVSLIDSTFTLGELGTLASANNVQSPFRLYLSPDMPPGIELKFRLGYDDGFYEDFEYIKIFTEAEDVIVDNGTVAISVAADGQLGYNPIALVEGIGLTYNNENILDEIGVLHTGTSSTVSDNMINVQNLNIRDEDFTSVDPIKIYNNSTAFRDARSSFMNTGLNEIRVEQKALVWESPDDGLVVLDYRFINTSSNTILNFHAGLYADFDLGITLNNRSEYDAANQLSYTHSNDNMLFAGVAVLDNETLVNSGIDLITFNGNSADVNNDISDADKLDLLLTGTGSNQAGVNGTGNDVAQLLSVNVGDLLPGEVKNVSFALVAGESLLELQDRVSRAKTKLSEYKSNPPVLAFIPICAGSSATINPPNGDLYSFYSDAALQNLISTENELTTAPLFTDSIFYVVNKDNLYDGEPFQMKVLIQEPQVEFNYSPDTLFLDEESAHIISFTDQTESSVQWTWDFGNGFSSIAQNPQASFFQPGVFNVRLDVVNSTGCDGFIEKDIVVIERSPKPAISNQTICAGESISFIASNTNAIRVYKDAQLTQAVFEGLEFQSTALGNDTTFYVTNIESQYESLTQEVHIDVLSSTALFEIVVDSINLSQKDLIHFANNSINNQLNEWSVNGVFYSNDISPSFNIETESSIEIKLITESPEGCIDEQTQIYAVSQSPTPLVSDITICENESTVISPGNGAIFYFYSDVSLNNLLHKGNTYSTGPLAISTTYYITGFDALAEGDAVAATVAISDFEALYDVSPSTLNLEEQNNAQFSDESMGVVSRQWTIDGIEYAGENPIVFFDELGTYDVRLVVSNSIGCTDIANFQYQVVSVLGNADDIEENIVVYPNPSKGLLTVVLPIETNKLLNINVFDALGRKVQSAEGFAAKRQLLLDLGSLRVGLYHLKITNSENIFSKTIILEK